MFEEYLEVAYEKQTRKQATFEVVGLLEGLPDWEVEKIAEGMPVSELYGHLDHRAPGTPGVKVAFSELKCGGDSDLTFLEAFKGTPLFDQAIALEQEEIQASMLDQQKRQERRAMSQGDDQLWDARDKIRLRKRLLELELAKSQNGSGTGAPVPGVPDQGSGAPGPVPAEGVQDSSGGLGGGVAKVGFAVTEKGHKFDAEKYRLMARHDSELAEHSQGYGGLPHRGAAKSTLLDKLRFGTLDANGQRPDINARHHEYAAKKHEAGGNAWNPFGGLLTPSSHEEGGTTGLLSELGKSKPKHAEAEEKLAFADKLGRMLARAEYAKHAGIGDAIGKSLNGGGLGQLALKAMKHPGAAGAIAGGALGAAGGAIAGGPDNRLGGALGGAALGAGAGHVAGGIGGHVMAGKGLGDAAKAYGGGVLQKAQSAVGAGPKA
jgi:hypothetical protein